MKKEKLYRINPVKWVDRVNPVGLKYKEAMTPYGYAEANDYRFNLRGLPGGEGMNLPIEYIDEFILNLLLRGGLIEEVSKKSSS